MNILDIKKTIKDGNALEALERLNQILSFSPRHHEALYLKSLILDKIGRFDESFSVIRYLLKENFSDYEFEEYKDLKRKIREDKHELYQTKLTEEGRVYFINHENQMGVSFLGIVGCIIFFFMMQNMIESNFPLLWMISGFFLLVLLPFFFLLYLYFFSMVKIVTNKDFLSIHYRFKKKKVIWSEISGIGIYYCPIIKEEKLFLKLFTQNKKEPEINLDISEKNSPVKARKHLVRTIINYVNLPVSYISISDNNKL
jgi:tetratricopeptide (TPR) repeat protein